MPVSGTTLVTTGETRRDTPVRGRSRLPLSRDHSDGVRTRSGSPITRARPITTIDENTGVRSIARSDNAARFFGVEPALVAVALAPTEGTIRSKTRATAPYATRSI